MKKGKVVLLCVMLVLLTAALTFTLTIHFAAPRLISKLPVTTKVAAVESRLQKYFIDAYDEKVLADAAADAIIEATGDRWSYYIPAESYQTYQDSVENAYTGIGVTIYETPTEKGFEVATVQEGGPAAQAGIIPGDILTHVDGEDVVAMGFSEMRNRVRGGLGTTVRLTLLRGEESYTADVLRQRIDTLAAQGSVLESGVGYVRIANFDRNAAKQAIEALESLKEQNVPGVIFDVRSNPGGLQTELVQLLDYLLPEGVVFKSVDYTGQESFDKSDAACFELPMVVLVDKNTYSAAEFFAAALQDYGKAKIVGESTSGKGNYQVALPLPDGSAMNISVGKYYTPSGKSLTGVGLSPDVVIEIPEGEAAAEAYAKQLETAESMLRGDASPNKDT